MKIGLIDVDGHSGFPNLPLMKISAFHKSMGDIVEWYSPINGEYDKVYMSKVFSFTPDYEWPIYAKEISKGGTGYCIELKDGKEIFHQENNNNLPAEIEHMFPDYSLYNTEIGYGFLTRGCPRGCDFCHVVPKEGRCSRKVANLDEFWNGQKEIVLLDPNITACKDWKELFSQLIESKARVDFSQGVDIRLLTDEKAEMLGKIKAKAIHFAWDNPKDNLEEKFKAYAEIHGAGREKSHGYNGTVFCLVNFGSTIEEDLYRINTLRKYNYQPYVMIYDKEHAPRYTRRLQRWCNNPLIFWRCPDFKDYDARIG